MTIDDYRPHFMVEAVYDLKGDARLPIKNVEIRNVTVGEVTKFVKNVVNAENVVEENIIYKEKQDLLVSVQS